VASSQSPVIDTVVAFLKNVPPFQFLSPYELANLAGLMTLEYFPKNTLILSAGRKAPESLYVVHKGGVKLALRTLVGKELILDMRSEGEVFGLLSMMSGDVTRLDVIAIEDTLCYALPAHEVQRLISKHSELADYLLRTSLTRYMDRTLNELRSQTNLMGDTERLLYALSVRDVVRERAVTCELRTTVRDAARLVREAESTALFVVNGQGQAVGIVTDKDFTDRVVARGLLLDLPVEQIMSKPVISVDGDQRIFEALLSMLTHDIHHVLVTKEGLPDSLLTSHDLMLLQGKSPLSLARHLEQQRTLDDLVTAQKRISDLLPLLLREGAKASHITRVVAEINDRLLSKIIEFAHEKLGPAPVPYCWVVLGSEGRREQTFKTDQDNALVFAGEIERAATIEYFAQFTALVHDALEKCGYPPCAGGYMASNSRWRQSLRVWKNYFRSWISQAELHSVEDALILFDMRPVAGEFGLFEELRTHTRDWLKEAGFFKSVLAHISLEHRPPLGFFRTFVVERTGNHRDELDIKMLGTGPIVNAARLFALDAGISETSTIGRLSALEASGYCDPALLSELQQAFEFLTLLRLEHQLQQARSAKPLDNYIRPERLSHLQKSLLKESFRTVGRAQSLMEEKFRTAVWAQLDR
jgi:CBS domain-containing protein